MKLQKYASQTILNTLNSMNQCIDLYNNSIISYIYWLFNTNSCLQEQLCSLASSSC